MATFQQRTMMLFGSRHREQFFGAVAKPVARAPRHCGSSRPSSYALRLETARKGPGPRGGAWPGMDQTRWYARYIVFMLILALCVAFLDRQILNLLIDPIKKDIGINDVEVGLLASPAVLRCSSR